LAVLVMVVPALAVEIIAHRGASYDAPENTLASVNLAWTKNADAVEIDVYLSRDDQIVVIHDSTTKRTGGKDAKVVEQTLDELRQLDVGSWKDEKYVGERIPTLAEVLATIPAGKRLFIEVKCGPEIVPVLQKDLRQAGKSPEQTVIIGFSYEAMLAAKQALPDLQVYWLASLKQDKETGRWNPPVGEMIEKAKAAGFDGLNLSYKAEPIDEEFAQAIKRAGLGFYVWTVNSADDARRARRLGVEGITTDRPAWLRARLSEIVPE
jgi:glycerophosphoryl diester phosphodiesterase